MSTDNEILEASPQSLAEAKYIVDIVNSRSGVDGVERLDADETNALALELEALRPKVYEEKFALLKARQIIPVGGGDIDPGAETFAHETLSEVAEFKEISNYADDFPGAETVVGKVAYGIVGIGGSAMWTIQDVRRAAMFRRPLPVRKLQASRRAFERKLDSIASDGSPSFGIPSGLCNKVVGTGATQIRGTAVGTAADWADATRDPEGMLADLNSLVRGFVVDSDESYVPDTLVLPLTHHMALAQTRMSELTDTTVLQAFLSANPMIRDVIAWNKLASRDSGGADDRGLMLMRSLEVLELILPVDYEVFPVQQHNLAFKVIGHGRTGGCVVHSPLGCRYLTGLPHAL